MRSIFYPVLCVILLVAALPLEGCAWKHHKKSRSYNRAVYDESENPTIRPDRQRAGETVRYVE